MARAESHSCGPNNGVGFRRNQRRCQDKRRGFYDKFEQIFASAQACARRLCFPARDGVCWELSAIKRLCPMTKADFSRLDGTLHIDSWAAIAMGFFDPYVGY
jgi:hypothetical protein